MSSKLADYLKNDLGRRAFLKQSMALLGGSAVLAGAPSWLQAAVKKKARAKAVIQIWMWGGPSHLDTFDPKPDAGYNYCGPLDKTVATNVKDIRLNAALPRLAQLADKYSIIRSMTHGINGHETASYLVQTGRQAGGSSVYPCVGGVVSYFKGRRAGNRGLVPPYIVLTRPQGRFSEAGFLGQRFKPFATGGNPAAKVFAVEGVVAKGISKERQLKRRDLLRDLQTWSRYMGENPVLAQMDKAEAEAYDLILGESGKVFDLNQESPQTRQRYGRSKFGQSCLVAKRLVASGVPYVTINYTGWDSHKKHFESMRSKLPQLDQGFSALLEDLDKSGLLDSTIVWWGGEFGRTPKIQWEAPWNGGRGHFGQAFSTVVAGGGFKGGQVVGSTNATGEEVRARPVYPWDLISSIYELLGIDSQWTLPHPQGYKVSVLPTAQEGVAKINPLKEIM
jgi:uncharacterized protein (DUF1501 family)